MGTGLSVEQCEARCDADATCDCVTYRSDLKDCWKRAACVESEFETLAAYDVYMRQRAPTPAPPPTPTLVFTGFSLSGFSSGACMSQIHFMHFAGQADGIGYDGCTALTYSPGDKPKLKGKGVYVESGLYDP